MKNKFSSVKICLLVLVLIMSAVSLGGCGETPVQVENLITLKSNFAGTRTVTCNFGTDANSNTDRQQEIADTVKEYCPADMTYDTLSDDSGFKYVFTIEFGSLADYKTKVGNILSKEVFVALATPNSELAKGWHLKEDFDGMQLIQWLRDAIHEKGYRDISSDFQSVSNICNNNGELVSSNSSVMDVNALQGSPVNGVDMETTNNKDGSYDRTLTLSVPQSTFDNMGSVLENIMKSRTQSDAVYSGWSQKGNYREYTAMYQGIDLTSLQNVTNLFLGNSTNSIYYGDENKSSTPLAEQLVFEENIDLLGFVPADGTGAVTLNYRYSLPIKTTHGQGVVLSNGEWNKQGEWTDGVYTLQVSDQNMFDIRVPDGMQYNITGINVNLSESDCNNFTRTMDFLYDKQLGQDGQNYAYNFLKGKGVNVVKDQTTDSLVCRITFNGSAHDISNALGDLFGGGNYMEYSYQTSNMAVVTDITVEDNINITYMLTGDNINIPFNYTVSSSGAENISSLIGTNEAVKEAPKTTTNSDGTITCKLTGGNNNISYAATVPYAPGVITYCIVAGVMLAIAALLIVLFFKKSKKLNEKDKEQLMIDEFARQPNDEAAPNAPDNTTQEE